MWAALSSSVKWNILIQVDSDVLMLLCCTCVCDTLSPDICNRLFAQVFTELTDTIAVKQFETHSEEITFNQQPYLCEGEKESDAIT